MRVEHIADGVSIHLGDCLEILPTLEKSSHVISDPPFESHMHDRRTLIHRTDGYTAHNDLGFASIEGIRDEAAKLMVANSSGWLIVFCTPEGVAPWRDAIEAAGARYKRACAWVKPDSAPQFNGQGPAHGFENFCTAWCGDGISRWNGGGKRGVFTHPVNPPSRKENGGHKTEKPISLMGELVILFTDPGETICDTFMGSGSTGVAAVKYGRKFIGIEKDPKWFDVACNRIAAAIKQTDFFDVVPKMGRKQEPLFGKLPTQKKKIAGAA